jgi:hypothetical protein
MNQLKITVLLDAIKMAEKEENYRLCQLLFEKLQTLK